MQWTNPAMELCRYLTGGAVAEEVRSCLPARGEGGTDWGTRGCVAVHVLSHLSLQEVLVDAGFGCAVGEGGRHELAGSRLPPAGSNLQLAVHYAKV